MSENTVSYDAEEAGKIIGQSPNWMKTQARAGKIPFTRVGRQMRWTPQHIAEILRAGEQKPRPVLVARPPARHRTAPESPAVLQAKPPRRKASLPPKTPVSSRCNRDGRMKQPGAGPDCEPIRKGLSCLSKARSWPLLRP